MSISLPQLARPIQPTERINSPTSLDRINSSINLKKKLSAVLSSCRICLSSVFEPACLTNCGHRFCEECLNTYWHVNNKPEYIVCPLCRGEASDIAFVLKDDASSTKDLRNTFNIAERANSKNKTFMSIHEQISMNQSTLCLKMMLIPAFYWIFNWLKAPMMQLVSYFQQAMLKLK